MAASQTTLTAQELATERQNGTVVVDVRLPDEFTRNFIAGAINIAWSPRSLPDRLQRLIPPPAQLVFIADEEQYARLRQILPALGYSLAGRIQPDASSWASEGYTLVSVANLELEQILNRGPELLLLDVRDDDEWTEGHVTGAYHLPLPTLPGRAASFASEVGDTQAVAVICEAGVRSSTAASILHSLLKGPIYNVPAGMYGWREAAYPLETED